MLISESSIVEADAVSTPGLGNLQAVLAQLSEPNRLRIFALLARGEACVCEIENAMALPQNLVSHHLRVMREAGLVLARREGRWMHYAVNKQTLEQIYPVVCALLDPARIGDRRSSC
jgi:ArsR family transcriptional regulator